MEQKEISLNNLQDFVESHKLRNRHSIIHFNAIVTITTSTNNINNQLMEVLISLDGYNSYGTVKLLENDLDPLVFPVEFAGKWQNILHVDKVFLKITGKHTNNPKIGTYEIKIVPRDKIRD